MEAKLNKFAYTVIEVSGTSLHTQCKEKMQVLAKHQGSGSYPGPALIVNLIKLSSAMCAAVVDDHNNYMNFHSKAVSILMEKVDKGGCFAAGPLTSQGLLHTMAALGLIPIKFANCGEVVKVPNFLANIEKNNHCQKYLQLLALSLNISLAEAEQVTCKF
jgi:hypothetical protein